MLPVKTLIRRIRTRVHDTENLEYLDDEILDVINSALRFIRRSVTQLRPAALVTLHEGVIDVGTSSIRLDFLPTRIVSMTVGDKIFKTIKTDHSEKIYQNSDRVLNNQALIFDTEIKNYYAEKELEQTDMAHILKFDSSKSGMPEYFYQIGQTINFYPTPNLKLHYTMYSIDNFEELTIEDKSPLPTDFDDFLIEYAVIRLSLENEFNMSEENQMMTSIFQQIQMILPPPPPGFICKSYWTKGTKRCGGYW